MGWIKYSVVVVVSAVLLARLPGWFQEKAAVPPVTGIVQPGWEHVRDVYRKLYADEDDRGSNLAVYHKGKLVVDLRGGFANENEQWPWQENTITRIFSTSKGIAALCVALLVDRGLIKYDEPVINYWPMFGQNGKEKITVEMLLSHQTGLAAITSKEYKIWDEVYDIMKVERLLAEQKPLWEIGTGVGYHGMTIGLYMDQIVRHTDPKHRGIPQFFKEEIAEPYGIDLQFGLADKDVYRAATMSQGSFKLKYLLLPTVQEFMYALFLGPKDPDVPNLLQNITELYNDPSIVGSVFERIRPDVNKMWNPSAFSHSNGRALAKLYGVLANGGSDGKQQLMSNKTLDILTDVIKTGKDKCLMGLEISYGRGFTIHQSPKNTAMFGTPGFGGQIGYADPTYKLGIGFVSNYLSSTGFVKDHRYIVIEKAIYNSLDAIENKKA